MMTIEVQEQGKMTGKWQQMRPNSERQRAERRKKAEVERTRRTQRRAMVASRQRARRDERLGPKFRYCRGNLRTRRAGNLETEIVRGVRC
jgi:hypothetical protein